MPLIVVPVRTAVGADMMALLGRGLQRKIEAYSVRCQGVVTTPVRIEDCCIDWGPGDTKLVFQTMREGNLRSTR
jgi:hypothetical protein